MKILFLVLFSYLSFPKNCLQELPFEKKRSSLEFDLEEFGDLKKKYRPLRNAFSKFSQITGVFVSPNQKKNYVSGADKKTRESEIFVLGQNTIRLKVTPVDERWYIGDLGGEGNILVVPLTNEYQKILRPGLVLFYDISKENPTQLPIVHQHVETNIFGVDLVRMKSGHYVLGVLSKNKLYFYTSISSDLESGFWPAPKKVITSEEVSVKNSFTGSSLGLIKHCEKGLWVFTGVKNGKPLFERFGKNLLRSYFQKLDEKDDLPIFTGFEFLEEFRFKCKRKCNLGAGLHLEPVNHKELLIYSPSIFLKKRKRNRLNISSFTTE